MRILMTLLTAIVFVASVAADNPETAVERSHARARRVLDAAVDAIGGRAAVEGVKAVRIRLAGASTPRFQSATPEPPYTPGRYQEETVLDLEQNRLAVVQTNTGAGFRGSARIVLNGSRGQTFDLLNRTATPIDAASAQQQQFAQYQRRLPSLILRTALQREATLRYVGEDTVNGGASHVVTFVHVDGLQMALYVDAKTNLISKYELIYQDTVTGDDASEIYFDEYRKVGALLVPSTFLWKQAGEVVAKWAYDVAFDPQIADATFEDKTDGFRVLAGNPAQAAQQRRVGVEKLGEGVYLVNNLGGGAYNVMAVEFADHVVAIEAPLGAQVGEQAIAEIKKAIPNKPVTHVAITHHHDDHSGGLRAFVADGAAVVTTPGNVSYVKSLVASKELRDALASSAKPLKLEPIENKKRVFSDGTQTLELYDIGPNSHAREMLVAYLPKQRIVFQGDLFFSPFDGQPVGFAQKMTQEFAARIRALGLQVDKLAGVHGKVGSMNELDQSLELARKLEGGAATDQR
jgi:glyoxylase-like metal-dependent hydrolase (beta-lactamase superfamily II)